MTKEQIAELLMRLREISESLAKLARPIRNICLLCGNPVYPDEEAVIYPVERKARKEDRYVYADVWEDITLPSLQWIHKHCFHNITLI